MARTKPIPRKARLDLHSPALREDYNRGKILRRDKDDQPNISNSIMDMDKAIMYYFNEVIKPTVVDNGETVKVPVMYASPERWYGIQRNGFLRDKRQQIITPVIVFRRTSMQKNENIPSNKLDANNPHNFRVLKQTYTRENRFDDFKRQIGIQPQEEYYNVVVPDYVILNYEFIIWTSYIEQMNKIVERINYTDNAYWGEPGKMRFRSKIESFTDASEMDTTERLIKTTFSVEMMGYILLKDFNNKVNTEKFLSPKRLIFNMETEKTIEEVQEQMKGGGVIETEPQKDFFGIRLSNPLTFTAGTGVVLSNSEGFDGSAPYSQQISLVQDISPTADVVFNKVSTSEIVFGNPTTYSYTGISGSINITGSLTTNGDVTINGDMIVGETLFAKEFKTSIVSSSIIFQSGSSKLGDSIDDTHEVTGSYRLTGSFEINGTNINEISNDTTLGGESPNALVTEYAVANFSPVAVANTVQQYIRKNFVKTSAGISGSTTASFIAVSASAPVGYGTTSEDDFIFFINGQYMEHDALEIEQKNSDEFLLKINTDSIGYELETDDEILAIGKFNS
jgi:hypothetical protein|tara:strand:- start:1463 stop:3157 length:1695 start_codon:yes stop_codon:yes gene_type:complete